MLTSLFDVGLNLFIPIVSFLVFVNYKNLPLIMVVSFISLFLFNQQALIVYLVFIGMLSLYALIFKHKSYYLNIVFVLLANLVTSLIIFKINNLTNLWIVCIYSLIGVILFCYFQFNLEGSIYKQNKIRNFTYIEFIMAIISVFGASKVTIKGVNIALFVSIFLYVFFSK